jgi:hypothetical protein
LVDRVTDPRLLNRVLGSTGKTVLIANDPATGPDHPPPAGSLFVDAVPLDPGVLRINPDLTLVPGQRYQLTLHFLDHTYAGVLQLLSLDVHPRFYREITLPEAHPGHPLTLTMWTSESETLHLAVLFRPADPAYAAQAHPRFLAYELQPYATDSLPIRVTSLAPYRAVLDAPQNAFLETHRFYARGYHAAVNGHDAPVTESPQHLVMLPLDAGKNEVRLDYVGPAAVRATFWFSATAWLALGLMALAGPVKSLLARRA